MPPRAGVGDRIRQVLGKGRLPWPVRLYLLAIVLPIAFSAGPITLTGVRLLLIVMIVPMSIRLLMGAYGKVLLTDILFFVHILWATVALAVNNPEQVVTNAGSTGIEFIGGYVLGRAYIRDRESFVALIRALGAIAFCLAPFVIYEAATGVSPILKVLNSLPGVWSLRDIDTGRRLGLYRVQSVFVHSIHSGLFFALAFSLSFVGLKDVYTPIRRWTVSLIAALCAFLALSSGALLAMILQCGLILWALVFRKEKARWWYLFGLFALMYLLILLFASRPPLRVFMTYATFSPGTAYMRSYIFDYGMDNVWANPIFGIGLNDWVRPEWMYADSVDNFWLLTAMRYGLVGFIPLAVGYLWALWRVGTRNFDSDPPLWNLRRAWMFSFAGLTFTLCTVHVWHSVFSFVFFMFGSGMWFLYTQPQSPDETEAPAGPPDRRLRYTRFPEVRTRRMV